MILSEEDPVLNSAEDAGFSLNAGSVAVCCSTKGKVGAGPP